MKILFSDLTGLAFGALTLSALFVANRDLRIVILIMAGVLLLATLSLKQGEKQAKQEKEV
jgi:hypothetical protein